MYLGDLETKYECVHNVARASLWLSVHYSPFISHICFAHQHYYCGISIQQGDIMCRDSPRYLDLKFRKIGQGANIFS